MGGVLWRRPPRLGREGPSTVGNRSLSEIFLTRRFRAKPEAEEQLSVRFARASAIREGALSVPTLKRLVRHTSQTRLQQPRAVGNVGHNLRSIRYDPSGQGKNRNIIHVPWVVF